MPAVSLADARKEFQLALSEIVARFEFVRAAIRLRPRLADMLHWQNMDNDAKKLAQSFMSQTATDETLFYRGLVISLAGAFEHFIRRIVRDSVGILNKCEMPYDTLDSTLRTHNICRTGMALQTIFEPLDYFALDYEALSKNIGTCFSGSARPVLNADAFAIFVSAIPPEKLTEALSRVGVTLKGDCFGKSPTLRQAFEKADTRDTANALREFLKRFAKTRNKIAHSGAGGLIVTESDFEQYMKVFGTFGPMLISFVEDDLTKMVKR